MYQHHIREMAQAIIANAEDRCIAQKDSREPVWKITEQQIIEALDKYWDNKIADVWTIEDVQEWAETQRKLKISKRKAKEILKEIHNKIDAEFGIQWGVIDHYVSEYEYELKNRTSKAGIKA